MREMGELKWFLGIRVIRDRPARKIWLCQDSYIEKIYKRFGRSASYTKKPKTPMATEPLQPYDDVATTDEIHRYSQIVGSLTYPATITRADTAFTTKCLAQNLTNPGPKHFAAAFRCLDYLENTKTYALEYGGSDLPEPLFSAASDAAFADD